MTPEIVERVEQPYVSVRGMVTMRTFPEIADRLPEVFGWLAERGVAPVDAPFFKYNLIDMDSRLEVEAGVPVDAVLSGDDTVTAGVLPAGRYVTVTHVGHPDELIDVTAQLLVWAAAQGLSWDMTATDGGERWGCRLEQLLTNPSVQPDMSKWETRLQFRLAN
ncbi:GyrI-like domain-containing protein [Actinocrispum wychmicini]|uniref:Effector-binding domain-containing protein n=1 Tax=Actinocrispum wychmicini TaxID=1213861 RepID=A0A4R2JPT5_9PSEU|nr:GyrI-like domain-containing protein [Actinocrispum wychmicini]TCO61007.1 effector-binding domain-containing protein [Actinocrispum wychmicini]